MARQAHPVATEKLTPLAQAEADERTGGDARLLRMLGAREFLVLNFPGQQFTGLPSRSRKPRVKH